MKSRIAFGLAMMLAAVALSVLPAATLTVHPAQALGTCNAAQFVADVTVPDNSVINPGATFVKTWRLKNTGVCQWNTSYTLVYVSGTQMGGTTSVAFPGAVPLGQTVDLTVTLTAPNAYGTFRGNWQLRNASGEIFGIGTSHANPFWVQIKIVSASQNITAYDFVDNMCSAHWSYDGGPIPCPINTNKLLYGYVQSIGNPVLENGTTSAVHGLLTIPQSHYNGLIRGSFPVTDIFRGDHFQALVGCQFNAVNCFVTYELEYQVGDSLFTLWKSKEKYDGLMTQVDVDLTQIAGLKARLVLTILAAGPFEGDQPLWVAPRIVRSVAGPVNPPATLVPTSVVPTFVPTSTLGCDRAQFIGDVSVPDGSTFTPNASFTKTWRLKNTGACTWTTAYSLVFASGNRMSGPDSFLPLAVVPGQTIDLVINLTAPNLAGSYRGYWQLKNASGGLFGIGTNANDPFFVDINVSGTAVISPTPTRTTAPATVTPTFTPTPTATSSTTGNWSTYQNVKYGFNFKFPPGSTDANQSDSGGRVFLPITAGTNLLQKYLDVNVAEDVSPCKSPGSNPTAPSQNVTFNGIQFLKEAWVEGAMSHRGDYTAYSTVKGNACITLKFLLWSVVPGVLETPPPVFNSEAESAVFTTILSTYGNQ